MITEQLQKGIESLEQDFYDELELNNQSIIDDRVEELEEYFTQLELDYDYELFLINEELSEFYGLFDPYEK